MPWNPKNYPANWKQIVEQVRHRSGNRCECHGECGLHKTTPGPRRCCELNGQPAKWAKGKVVLTTAHTCKCDPPCGNLDHLKHVCQRCHLRLDIDLHMKNARKTREAKKNKNHLLLPL